MAKKKKETCPYCGKAFAYLSRHKCKIKELVEGNVDEKSQIERRIERIEEKKKNYSRDLRKDEKEIFQIIEKKKDLYFNELMKLSDQTREDLEPILEQLAFQSKIVIERELMESSWTKRIKMIETIDIEVKDKTIDKQNNSYVWEQFSYIPCFICPFEEKCTASNQDQFNPHYCEWLTQWIEAKIENNDYFVDFDRIQEYLDENLP